MKNKLQIAKDYLVMQGYSKRFAQSNNEELNWISSTIKQMKHLQSIGCKCFYGTIRKLQLMGQSLIAETEQLETMNTNQGALIQSIGDGELLTVLELRYIQQLPWKEISAQMFCSESKIFAMHQKALLLVYQQLNLCPTVTDSSKKN